MRWLDWLDSRTGLRTLARHLLFEVIPGGAKWRYVWGSTLVFVFSMQVITGLLLMTAYSPSATTAWSSVWYIQTQMTLGWFIRGLHHIGSQAMVVLIPIHVLQVVIARAYREPREVNWWTGLALMGVVLALSLTGYLLPWDQKGYWATKVATNIMGLTPIIGQSLQKIVIGGDDYGHATLTRFFTLHVMILPGTLMLLLIAHVALLRRHGVSVSPKHVADRAGNFWPDQAFRDTVAAAIVFIVILSIVLIEHYGADFVPLDAPADPTASDYPARPEWYFLFLFQMLKLFEGPTLERIGALGVPAVVGLVLFAVPLYDKLLPKRLAHALVVMITLSLFAGAGVLTIAAIRDDRDPSAETVASINARHARGELLTREEERQLRAWDFNRKRERADALAQRALQLASEKGIPPAGPLELLANDSVTRGPVLFAAHCTVCHRYHGHDGLGAIPASPATSSDLSGFGSRDWVRLVLADPMDPRRFGLMKNPEGEPAHTRMKKWIEKQLERNSEEQEKTELFAQFDAVAAYLAAEGKNPGIGKTIDEIVAPKSESPTSVADAPNDEQKKAASPFPEAHDETNQRGREVFLTTCNECHSYEGNRSGTTRAPDMFGYGGVDWIEQMIANPAHEQKYGNTGREPARMPAFADRLTPLDRRMIAEWLFENRDRK